MITLLEIINLCGWPAALVAYLIGNDRGFTQGWDAKVARDRRDGLI